MIKMTVHMTKEALYDFLLYHAYSKFSGFLMNILGFAVIFLGVLSYASGRTGGIGAAAYLAAAAGFIAYTPFLLRQRAKKQGSALPGKYYFDIYKLRFHVSPCNGYSYEERASAFLDTNK